MQRKSKLEELFCDGYPDRTFSTKELKECYNIYPQTLPNLLQKGKLVRVPDTKGKYQVAREVSRVSYEESVLKKLLHYFLQQDFEMVWITLKHLVGVTSAPDYNFLLLCFGFVTITPEEFREQIRSLTVKDILNSQKPFSVHKRETVFSREFFEARAIFKGTYRSEGEDVAYDVLCLNIIEKALEKQNLFYSKCIELEIDGEYKKLIDILCYLEMEWPLRPMEASLLRLAKLCLVMQRYDILPKTSPLEGGPLPEAIATGKFEYFQSCCRTMKKKDKLGSTTVDELLRMIGEDDGTRPVLSCKAMFAFYDMVSGFAERNLDRMLFALRTYLQEVEKPQLEAFFTGVLSVCVEKKDEKFHLLAQAFEACEGGENELRAFGKSLKDGAEHGTAKKPIKKPSN